MHSRIDQYQSGKIFYFNKISYTGKGDIQENKQLDFAKIKSLVKNSNFRAALEELESTEEEEIDSEIIYLRALCLEKIGLGTVSLSILDKHNFDLKNYLPAQHLKALIHYRSGDFEKAKKVLDFCLSNGIATEQTGRLLQKIKLQINRI